MNTPDRAPLSQKTADALEKAIRHGQWSTKLPGHRKLCDLMGVSPRTMHAALALLTSRNIILPPERTKPRLINTQQLKNPTDTKATKQLLILSACRHQEHDVHTRQIINNISSRFTKKGWLVQYEYVPEMNSTVVTSAMNRLLESSSKHSWLLVKPSRHIIEWGIQNDLKFVCLGGEPGGRRIPFIAAKLYDMLHISMKHLTSLGHHRICTLIVHNNDQERVDMSQHYQLIMNDVNLPFHPSYHLPLIHSDEASSLWDTLSQLFKYSPPTALIATDAKQLITIYSYCLQNNLRIPEDLSVIVTQQSRHLDWFHPQPARFTLPTAPYVNRASQWIEHYPLTPPEHVYVQPKFHAGESVHTREAAQ